MLDVKKLQAIRDKILGVTANPSTYGDLDSVVYLQQILDAVKGTDPLNIRGNLAEHIYLQKILNAKRGVADGQFGSLPNSIYLQQLINAYNGVTDGAFGSLPDNYYLDAWLSVSAPVLSWTPATAIGGVLPSFWIHAGYGLFQDVAGTIPATADTNPVGLARSPIVGLPSVSQAVAGKRPLLRTAVVNGQNVLRGDGLGMVLNGTFAPLLSPASFYYAAVGSGNVASNRNLLHFDTAGYVDFWKNAANKWVGRVLNNAGLGMTQVSTNTSILPVVLESLWVGGQASFYINGLQSGIDTGVAAPLTLTNINVLAEGAAIYWPGDFAEGLLYANSLNAAGRLQVKTYLSTKYGIAVV